MIQLKLEKIFSMIMAIVMVGSMSLSSFAYDKSLVSNSNDSIIYKYNRVSYYIP